MGFKGWLVDVIEANNEFGSWLRVQAHVKEEAKRGKFLTDFCPIDETLSFDVGCDIKAENIAQQGIKRQISEL